jgi:hypothetical protein
VRQLLAILAAVVTCAVAAQTPSDKSTPKEPWAWTTEQRLAARFDPVSIKERKAAYKAQLMPSQQVNVESEPVDTSHLQYSIDGKRNPELFFPFELLRGLLDSGFAKDAHTRELNRALYRDGIAALGVTEAEFWPLLAASQERAGHPYLAPSGGNGSYKTLCHVRVAVLNDMRRHFGQEVFDRFLYLTVAPQMAISSTTYASIAKRELLQEEAVCQE